MTDQHRFDCLGTTGNPDLKTPHIDSLADDSVVYENCFSAAPFCTPSRYSFVTGLYPHQHLGKSNHSTIPNAIDTFPKALRRIGYRTKAVGKMHYTPTYLDVGFDAMELAEQDGPGRYDDDYHRYLIERGLVDINDLVDQVKEYRKRASQQYWDSFSAEESNLPEEHHSTTWIGDRAVETLEDWDGDGNLLMVSFIKPHHLLDPPAPWSKMYDPKALKPLPGWTEECLERDIEKSHGFFPNKNLTLDKLQRAMANYYGLISQVDYHVGRMIQVLKGKSIYEDAIIVFTSDHGDYMGFHHMLLKSNYMYDPLVKIPLIIKYPGNGGCGMRKTELVSNVDIAPTVLKQCGLPSEGLPGEDLSAESIDRQYVFASLGKGSQYMLRSRTHKLIYGLNRKQRLFFDLEKDPFEMNNLYDSPEYSGEVQSFIHKLFEMMLFETVPPSYLDKEAPSVLSESNRQQEDIRHQEAEHWFRMRMNEVLP